jgi:hypothetical protein
MTAPHEPSERVLWTGEPQRIPLFEPVDRLAIPLQAAVVAFAVVFAVLKAGTLSATILWVCAAVGVLVLPVRMIARRVTARGSRYTVTDRRLIVRTRKGQEFTSDLRDLRPPVVHPHRDGTGTIVFRSERSDSAQTGPRLTLWGILDAERVREIIVGAQATE